MIVKCISALPSKEQAKRLGQNFRPGKQQFGIKPDERYVVFGLHTLGSEIWVDIMDPDLEPGYLFEAPLMLFEIVDPRVSKFWEMRITAKGQFKIAAPSMFTDYYFDRLFESVPEVVQDFIQLRARMEAEAGWSPIQNTET